MANKVFISYKNTVDGVKTLDADMAEKLYSALENKGISCFFAGKTLLELGADKYKDRIDIELDQCIILIVIGTSVKNIESRWVKYEWDGFFLDILNGRKNGKVFTYVEGINPHDLPRALRGVQCFDKKTDSIEKVVDFIQNAIVDIEGKSDENADKNRRMHLSETSENAFSFSQRFLHSGASKLINESPERIRQEIQNLSELYDSIYYVKRFGEKIQSDNIAKTIIEIITNECKDDGKKNLLKIKGPLGSYKNRLLQYAYLLIEKEEKAIIPFYIDLAMYEKSIENHSIDDKLKLEELVNDHFQLIQRLIASESDREPLLIIDGIRDFSSGRDRLYSLIKEKVAKLSCKIIVSLDTDFTNNPHHKFSLHPLAGTDYEYFIRITSMNIYNKEGSIRLIKNCLRIFNIKVPYDAVDETTIYNRLLKLNVIKIDAYWLANLLNEMIVNILSEDVTLADLYEAVCRKSLDKAGIDSAAKLAFDFEYGSIDFSESDFYFDTRWKVIRKHRSVLDYLIARYYIHQLAKINVSNISSAEEQLHFFNMILPKAVTVFVSPMINKVDEYESKVLEIAKKCYDHMSVLERNELIFWLGRLKNKTSREESMFLLKQYRTSQYGQYISSREDNVDVRNHAFLLRTICVSLIALGDKDSADLYFNLLLTDKNTNEVNRAFHLTYYGDQPYIPNKSLLDFDDDIRKGANTFEILCASIQRRIDNHEFSYMAVLELFTLCSLLQARIEGCNDDPRTFYSVKYADKAIRFIKWVGRQRRIDEFEKIKLYFSWMQGELERYRSDGETYSPSDVYNTFVKARTVQRTGWVKRNIPDPENIVEHMYNCWLLAMLYLPETSKSEGYDKKTVLDMLLLHDIGEAITGDIARPEKRIRQQFFDENENSIMQALMFSGTYPHEQSHAYQSCIWDEWYSKKGINYEIAKDVDDIQAIYQFCQYYCSFPELFDEDDAYDWYDGIYDIKTEEGRLLVSKLIVQNKLFKSINEKHGGSHEEY